MTSRTNNITQSDDIWVQLKQIRKELKKKVQRNQFITALASKLSISQLSKCNSLKSYLNYIPKENNQPNSHPVYGDNVYGESVQNLQSFENKQIYGKTKQIWKNKGYGDNQMIALKSHVMVLNEKINKLEESWRQQSSRQIDRSTKQTDTKQVIVEEHWKAQQRRISQLQAAVYRKSDRSQLDKLFTYNQLLVVQLQQFKQNCKQQIKQLKNQINMHSHQQFSDYLQKEQEKNKQTQDISTHRIQELQNKIHEMKNGFIEANVKIKELAEEEQCRWSGISQKLSNDLFMIRQLNMRVNVLETKEKHSLEAVKTVDDLKTTVKQFTLQMQAIIDKNQVQYQAIKQYCRQMNAKLLKDVYHKVENQFAECCSELTSKISVIAGTHVSKEEYQGEVHNIYEKVRRLSDRAGFVNGKLEEITQKVEDSHQLMEEQLEKIQEQISKAYKQIQISSTSLKIQFEQKIKTLISSEQLKEVAQVLQLQLNQHLQKRSQQQQKINEILCSENIVGKWIWNNNKTKGGNLIQWNKQLINSLPQNFIWNSQTEPMIIIVQTTGYYKIQMGFYAKKKPSVQLIVNGKTVISAVNSSSYVLHHSSGRLKDVGGKENSVSGLTYIDYFMIRQQARIAVSYSGQMPAQGFISIHRL